MIKDQVWWPSNQCCSQTTNPKHWFKTTIPNFVVISEELTKNSPGITRLPKMGPTQWYCVNYRETNVIANTIFDQWEQDLFTHWPRKKFFAVVHHFKKKKNLSLGPEFKDHTTCPDLWCQNGIDHWTRSWNPECAGCPGCQIHQGSFLTYEMYSILRSSLFQEPHI